MADAQPPVPDATSLLARVSAHDTHAVAELFPMVYAELRRLAHRQLAREPDGKTLGTTELVHEAYLRLVQGNRGGFEGRAHFMAIAAVAMRRILVDRARARRSEKRGGGLKPVPLDALDLASGDRAELLVALDDALEALRRLDERQSRIVECRFFGGMTEEETASALGIGLRTVKRDWARARSWLYREIYPGEVQGAD